MVSIRILSLSVAAIALANGQDSRVTKSAFAPDNVPSRAESAPVRTLTAEERGDLLMARKMYREAVDSYQQGPKNSPVLRQSTGIEYLQIGHFAAASRYSEPAI